MPSTAYSDSTQPFGTEGPVLALARLMPFPPVISFVTAAAGPGTGASAALGTDDGCVDVEDEDATEDFGLEPDEHAASARANTARGGTTRCLIGAVWLATSRSDNVPESIGASPKVRPVNTECDPFLRDHLDDPYPFYARLRARPEDFVAVPGRGVVLAARHEVARMVLRHHHTYLSGLGVQWVPVAEAGLRATFIENDPPAHTRVRRAVQRWCTPRAVAQLDDVVGGVVSELVDRFVETGGGDVMAEIARPLPLRVMGAWLGVDLPDAATTWADASFRMGAPDPPADASEQFAGFLEWALGEGFATVRPDGMAAAILAGGDHGGLHDDEGFVALASIIIAGLDTTVHLIGNGIAALASHRDQFESLVDDPGGRAAGTVEEVLRFDAPVRFFLRRTETGPTVVVLYGSANRDERAFDDPDRFLIDRDASEHLAFGSGIHLCLGAPLARLEGTTLFRTLAERIASIELLPGAARTDSAAIRGFATLPVRVQPR